MCGFDRIRRVNYYVGEPVKRAEIEQLRVGKLKNRMATVKDEIAGEMIKVGGERVVDWFWRLYMSFESGVVPEDWTFAVIVPLYKGKGESTECKNYRGISLLSVGGKIYAGILVESDWGFD